MSRPILLSVVILSFFAQTSGATAPQSISPTKTESKKFHIQNYENIFLSGTPEERDLAKFKKQNKGAVVVDLRSIDELGNCSEPVAASKLGLQYGRVNFEKEAPISEEVIAQIDKAVHDANGKPVLLFCKTGNRAAAWLAIHLVRDTKLAPEEAIRIAQEKGLREDMTEKVRQYLNIR